MSEELKYLQEEFEHLAYEERVKHLDIEAYWDDPEVKKILKREYRDTEERLGQFLDTLQPVFEVCLSSYPDATKTEKIKMLDEWIEVVKNSDKHYSRLREELYKIRSHEKRKQILERKGGDAPEEWERKVEIARETSIEVVCSKLGITFKRGKAVCPLHKEKTGSFSINVNKNMFYCFGCHEGGDGIKLVRQVLNCTFKDAILFIIN